MKIIKLVRLIVTKPQNTHTVRVWIDLEQRKTRVYPCFHQIHQIDKEKSMFISCM
ncbi:hypothetical protein HanXRQr2_Chr14g0670781 [Helianthus annuus]|uniref:Uncharacterized protein n=1 Tax=Helianthus annuus TaxID=4232 RepID=A0A251UX83_HELAN|nr:hypothetical protein HanXRQr2_Chr14g0670781 [Helianthus annuus]KAJ0842631.1 hypothetical protein HanPSC8_Chr14g0643841 [Helianthus annuus]